VIPVTDIGINSEIHLTTRQLVLVDGAVTGGPVQSKVVNVGKIKFQETSMITITGTVGSSGKYLVTSIPVKSKVDAVLKLSFENNTSGTNLALIAGTNAQFTSGTGGSQISDSGGPGFRFLTITDTAALSGLELFVRRVVGSANSDFTLVVD
jgi:hypothetical protein